MPYECQTFKKGQVLTHECMNKIDEWLAYICGREIVSGEVKADGELVFTTCDGSTLSVGKISSSGGGNGKDGISPTVEIVTIEGGKRITITDANGSKSADIMDGEDGSNGKDGVSATHSWNGTTLTVASASGSSSANLKGDKGDKGDTGAKGDKGDTGATGKDGKTPVRGTDYWTEADKAEIKSYVDEAILGGAW